MNNQKFGYQDDNQKITLDFATGKEIILNIITPEIIEVFEDHGCATNSYAIEEIKNNRQTTQLLIAVIISKYRPLR